MLLHLPEEIQLEIFSYLSGPDLARTAELSTQCARLCMDQMLWKRLCLRQADSTKLKIPIEEAYESCGKDWRKLFIERFCYLHPGRCSFCYQRVASNKFAVRDYDVFELLICWRCVGTQIISKAKARHDFYLRDCEMLEGENKIRFKSYPNYFVSEEDITNGNYGTPIREFLRRDVERLAYKLAGGEDRFKEKKWKRQSITERRMKTRNRNAKEREAGLAKALAEANIKPLKLERGADPLERRLLQLTTNYIKHGEGKRAKTSLIEIIREAKLLQLAQELQARIQKSRVKTSLELIECYNYVNPKVTIEEMEQSAIAHIEKLQKLKEKRLKQIKDAMAAIGIVDFGKHTPDRFGVTFAKCYLNFMSDENEKSSNAKLEHLVQLASDAERKRFEDKKRAKQIASRSEKMMRLLKAKVPHLISDPLFDPMVLPLFRSHVHWCEHQTGSHCEDVAKKIIILLTGMSRRKNALRQAFIEAGLGEPPFGSSHLHSYDEKLKEFVRFDIGSIQQLMEQRRAHLKQQESIELNRKQKEERTLLLANAMKQRGIRQTPGFRYPNYWDTYIEGKLPLCVQDVCTLIAQQQHMLAVFDRDQLSDDFSVRLTLQILALHYKYRGIASMKVADIDCQWMLRMGSEYSGKGRRLSDLLRKYRDLFNLSDTGEVSLLDTQEETIYQYLMLQGPQKRTSDEISGADTEANSKETPPNKRRKCAHPEYSVESMEVSMQKEE